MKKSLMALILLSLLMFSPANALEIARYYDKDGNLVLTGFFGTLSDAPMFTTYEVLGDPLVKPSTVESLEHVAKFTKIKETIGDPVKDALSWQIFSLSGECIAPSVDSIIPSEIMARGAKLRTKELPRSVHSIKIASRKITGGAQVLLIVGNDKDRNFDVALKLGRLEKGGALVWVPLVWANGSTHELTGTLFMGGYRFESISSDPLKFRVDHGKGYVHVDGTGAVETPDGKVMQLTARNPGAVIGKPLE